MGAAPAAFAIWGKQMKHNPTDPKWINRDRFVLSKGHTAPALYSTLAHRGFFPVEELKDGDRFIEIFKEFYSKNSEMRKYLQNFMPDYIGKAENSIKELFKI